MVVAAVNVKSIWSLNTFKALNIIFPTISVNKIFKDDDIGGSLIEWSVKIPRQGIFISRIY